MKKINWFFVYIILFSAFLYFFQLGFSTAWDQDEGQMFAASLEMVKSGEYLTPHLNSALYFHKPPFYAWLTALMFMLFGFTEFCGRFWAAIFGICGVSLTYFFAKRLYNERAAILSSIILATSPLYFILAKMGLVDILLAFFVLLSLCFFHLGYHNPIQKKWFYLLYVAMAFGTITKGPLGILIPCITIFLFLLWEKKLSFFIKMVPLKGFLLYFIIASPWFIIETIRHGTYFLKIMFGQFLFSIYFTPFQQHPGPIYYYIIVTLVGFIPWSGFLFPALFKKTDKLMLLLFLVMLAIFSLASTKVPGYFLPAFPALAIITGSYLDRLFSGESKLSFYFGLIFPILLLSVVSFVIFQVQIPLQFSQALIYLQTLILIVLGGFFLSFLFSFLKPQPIWSIGGWVVTMFVFYIGFIVFLVPYAEGFKPSRELAVAMKDKAHVAFYKTWLPPSLVFYLNRQSYPTVSVDIGDANNLEKFLNQHSSVCYLPKEEEQKLLFPHRLLKTKAGYVIIERIGRE